MLAVAVTMLAFYPILLLVVFSPSHARVWLLSSRMAWRITGISVASTGIALMAWSYAVLHSFRLLAQVDPDHEMCARGPYSLVRHPIYLGIDLFYLGCFVLLPYVGFLLQTIANALAYDLRARVEEDVMQSAFGETYRAYTSRTYRMVPRLY